MHVATTRGLKNFMIGGGRYARMWGDIQIVWEEWLEATIRLGVYRQDESTFAVHPADGWVDNCLQVAHLVSILTAGIDK